MSSARLPALHAADDRRGDHRRRSAAVLRSGWITSGPKVREFESQLSALCGGRPVRALSSATGGMEIALALAGIGAGDEVITTPLSWVATGNVVLRARARPVFVDCDPRTRNIDLELVPAAITPRTRAMLPVDLAGLPVDRDRLYAIAAAHRLRVIEDAAQSFGANWAGRMIGSCGDLVSISFHANKNVTTAEGGCLVLNDEAEARRCELWRLQGAERRGDSWDGMDVALAGGKHNMTDIAATHRPRAAAAPRCVHGAPPRTGAALFRALRPDARLRAAARGLRAVQLAHVPGAAARGRASAAPSSPACARPASASACTTRRCTCSASYRQLGWRAGDFPHAERIGARIVSLPMFAAMQDQDVDRVLSAFGPALAAASAPPARAAAGQARP